MICPDCKAAAMKVCADHHRTSNIEDDADREIDRLRARVAELEAALASMPQAECHDAGQFCDSFHGKPCTCGHDAIVKARGGGA